MSRGRNNRFLDLLSMHRTIFSIVKGHLFIETDLSMDAETPCFARNIAVSHRLTVLLWRSTTAVYRVLGETL
jgi:hypothetical protein